MPLEDFEIFTNAPFDIPIHAPDNPDHDIGTSFVESPYEEIHQNDNSLFFHYEQQFNPEHQLFYEINNYEHHDLFEVSGQYLDISPLAAVGNNDVSITLISVTNTSIIVDLFFNPTHFYRNNILRYYDFTVVNPPYNGAWVEAARSLPSGTSRFTISDLTPGASYRLRATTWDASTNAWSYVEMPVRTNGVRTPSLTATNITPNSFTINAVFPSNGDHGNRLRFFDGLEWTDVAGPNHLSSGSFTVSNLTPGIRYRVALRYMNRLTNTWAPDIIIDVRTPLPPESMMSFTRSNFEFRFDRFFVDMFDSGRLNRFLDGVNGSYSIQHGLVGGDLPFGGARMGFETSRTLPTHIEGISGQPIRWSIFNTDYHIATNHVLMMNRQNVDMTEAPIHEVAHNFQRTRWNFEPEALAIFQTYYHFAITGESMAVSNRDRVFTGGPGFKVYMRSYASRILGNINYDAAMAQNVYSPYSLAWNLANIQTQIGWEPFRQTFRAFDNLHSSQVPTRNIDKLNLFLTMLSDFSGQNVFNMFNAQERMIYEVHFGGRLERFNVAPVPVPVNSGIIYNSGIIRPVTASNNFNTHLDVNNLGINANGQLTFDLTVHMPNGVRSNMTGSRVLFRNPSFLRSGADILGTRISSNNNWDFLSMTLEGAADRAFLLPANASSLSGNAVIKLALLRRDSGDIYYFEVPISSALYAQYRAAAFNPPIAERDALNSNVHWYLNHNTADGPANNVSLISAQAGFPYNMIRVRQRIGHGPFNQTFNYFANLSAANMPSTQLGRVNLFLTKLRDFSGQSVIAMFTPQAIGHFGQVFGGTIAYVGGGGVTIHWSNPGGNHVPSWPNMVPGDPIITAQRPLPPATRSGDIEFVGWFRPLVAGLSEIYDHEHFDNERDTEEYILMYGAVPLDLPPEELINESTLVRTVNDTHVARWRPRSVTINTPTMNQLVPRADLLITWHSPNPSQVRSVTLTDTTVSGQPPTTVFSNRSVTGGSFTVNQNYLVHGRSYMLTVFQTLDGLVFEVGRVSFTVQETLQQGITVSVTNAAGQPIAGALVQFVRNTSDTVTSFRTNSNGVAVFPNAHPRAHQGTYGINVTHPNFASTYHTSRRDVVRTSGALNVPITMSEPTSTFRNLGWSPILEGIGTLPYEISSVYGFRFYGNFHSHAGIDIVERVGNLGLGRRVYSAFAGEVTHINLSSSSAGNGIHIAYNDPVTGTRFYARYLHLQHPPARADGSLLTMGAQVQAGEQIGFLGDTPPGTAAHKHIDVHRNFNPSGGQSFLNSIDPRAFFSEGFVGSWNGLNIQP